MIQGVCKYCGCTEQRACPGGCQWIHEEETICSRCAPAMTAEDVLRVMAFDHRGLAGEPLIVPLDSVAVQSLIGMLQVALRHPQASLGQSAEVARRFIAGCQLTFEEAGCHGIAELIRRGNDPAHDQPAAAAEPQQQPLIIVP